MGISIFGRAIFGSRVLSYLLHTCTPAHLLLCSNVRMSNGTLIFTWNTLTQVLTSELGKNTLSY